MPALRNRTTKVAKSTAAPTTVVRVRPDRTRNRKPSALNRPAKIAPKSAPKPTPAVRPHGHIDSAAMSVRQAGARLGLSPSSIKNLCARGELEAFKTGDGHGRGHWRVFPESVEAYLAKARHSISPVGTSSISRDRHERIEELTFKAQELEACERLDKLKEVRAQREEERKITAEAHRQEQEQQLAQMQSSAASNESPATNSFSTRKKPACLFIVRCPIS